MIPRVINYSAGTTSSINNQSGVEGACSSISIWSHVQFKHVAISSQEPFLIRSIVRYGASPKHLTKSPRTAQEHHLLLSAESGDRKMRLGRYLASQLQIPIQPRCACTVPTLASSNCLPTREFKFREARSNL